MTLLSPMSYEGVTVDVCNDCEGVFLDRDELTTIIECRDQKFAADVVREASDRTPVIGVPIEDLDRHVACPHCCTSMKPINYTMDSGIIVDRCHTCDGLWFDAKELEKVQLHIEQSQAKVPTILARHGEALAEAREEVAAVGRVAPCRIPVVGGLINSLINGMINLRD